MAFDKTDKNFVIAASISGILQGTAWTVLSLIAIILYNSEPLDLQPESYMGDLQNLWYIWYLTSDTGVFGIVDRSLKPSVFSGFIWVYFFLDLLWMCISLYIAIKTKDERIQKSITAWSYLTLFISLWDLITVIILGADYSSCMKSAQSDFGSQEICANAILAILMIAAKGFILWSLNIVIAIILLNLAKRIKKGAVESPAF